MRFILFLFIVSTIFSCTEHYQTNALKIAEANLSVSHENNDDFGNNKLGSYWYEGTAEITRYELSQNRYEANYPGHAILIFVTEDFLTDKQVKNDRYENKNSVSVLKNNQIIKFPTGIYDYSVMNSVFTPVNNSAFKNTLKISSSSQEWCGQTYTQLNLKTNKYVIRQHSYFEGEGDLKSESDKVILEDEIFNRIRINPEELPVGQHQILPSLVVTRFLHMELKPAIAKLSKEKYNGNEFTGKELRSYKIEYTNLNRKLEIIYEAIAPYRIVGWKDSYFSKISNKQRTTIAKRTHERKSAYWQENRVADIKLREELGLD